MDDHEFRVRFGEYVLRARPHEGARATSIEVQWLHLNGQPAHQPIYFEIDRAPEMLRMLATFAEAVRAGND
jgi:hypothetical protein